MDTQKVGRTKYAMAVKFFKEHAGFSYDPAKETKAQGKMRCARQLAKAEAWAKANECIYFEWQSDYSDYENSLGDHAYWCEQEQQGIPHRHKVQSCIMRKHETQVVASLGAILDADANYRRVIEAELALEAMD